MSDEDDDSNDDQPFTVRYGKPPKATRFRPGQSGNPKGRKEEATTVIAKLRKKLHQKLKLSDGTTSTPINMIIARAVHEIAAGKLGKWIPTLEYLEFDPKQKFKPIAADEERLNKLLADVIKLIKTMAKNNAYRLMYRTHFDILSSWRLRQCIPVRCYGIIGILASWHTNCHNLWSDRLVD